MASVSALPSNYGIITGYKKTYGKGSPLSKTKVVLVNHEAGKVFTYGRAGCCVSINGDEKGFLEARAMVKCPFELSDKGNCELRYDDEHRKNHYHFAYTRKGEVVYNSDGKPYCKYGLLSDSKPCWESVNAEHNRVFAHSF